MCDFYRLLIEDVFHLQDGVTVFAGKVDSGEHVSMIAGPGRLFVDGQEIATVELQSEMLFYRSNLQLPQDQRATATVSRVELTSEDVKHHKCWLEGPMRILGHRDLIGIDSPPHDFIPDRMTLGPRLPEGWDGDAWTAPDESHYFLRAWHKASGRFAIGRGNAYAEAREELLKDIEHGTRRAVVQAME